MMFVFQVSNFLVTINSSVNILIYCTFGKKFRTVFMQIFFGRQPPCIVSSSRLAHFHKNNSEVVALTIMKSNSRKSSYNNCNNAADEAENTKLCVGAQSDLTSADSILKASDDQDVLCSSKKLHSGGNKWALVN